MLNTIKCYKFVVYLFRPVRIISRPKYNFDDHHKSILDDASRSIVIRGGNVERFCFGLSDANLSRVTVS
jgi:hypothetical protein